MGQSAQADTLKACRRCWKPLNGTPPALCVDPTPLGPVNPLLKDFWDGYTEATGAAGAHCMQSPPVTSGNHVCIVLPCAHCYRLPCCFMKGSHLQRVTQHLLYWAGMADTLLLRPALAMACC